MMRDLAEFAAGVLGFAMGVVTLAWLGAKAEIWLGGRDGQAERTIPRDYWDD